MHFITVQIIGFIGLLFIVISFQKDKRSFTLISQLFAALFFAAHFSFLGAWTGATMNGLSAVRARIFNLRDSKKWINNKIVMYSGIIKRHMVIACVILLLINAQPDPGRGIRPGHLFRCPFRT